MTGARAMNPTFEQSTNEGEAARPWWHATPANVRRERTTENEAAQHAACHI
jgi:hypothetical protein